MKTAPFFVIGNWKSNKTVDEAVIWLQDFDILWKKQPYDAKKISVVLCVSYIHLTTLKSLIEILQLPIQLGAQTISSYESGAYTGETSGQMLSELVSFTLVGHSERRNYFNEAEESLNQKIVLSKANHIEPVYCVQSETAPIPEAVSFVGYEPVWAIGTGKAETAENANTAAGTLKSGTKQELQIIYGGSVNADNVASYVTMEHIGGVLPGGASLKPDTFYNLILNASNT